MRWFTFAIFFAVHGAFGQTISGRVIAVADGDTLTILDASNLQHKVRLAEIDAPERRQPFGTRSRQSLSDMCFHKSALVNDQGKDRYGRMIGRVNCAGIDTSSEQVRRGMAWVFDRYVKDRALYSLQGDARAARRGLWIETDPIPPWEWRKGVHRAQKQI